ESDHHTVVRSLGVGFLGRRNMLIGNAIDPARADCPGCGGPGPIPQPGVGLRYWIDDLIGIDGGIGFFFSSGSVATAPDATGGTTTTDEAGITALIIHAGVPLSLASACHFSFQIIPEVNVGSASQTVKHPAPP